MNERKGSEFKGSGVPAEYEPPMVLRLGSLATITANQVQVNSDDAVTADNAYPNPIEAS
jgi:hypothetical protein